MGSGERGPSAGPDGPGMSGRATLFHDELDPRSPSAAALRYGLAVDFRFGSLPRARRPGDRAGERDEDILVVPAAGSRRVEFSLYINGRTTASVHKKAEKTTNLLVPIPPIAPVLPSVTL